MAWSSWIDLELSDEEKLDRVMPMPMPQPSYPPEMRICFTRATLEKAGMDLPNVGDMAHMIMFGEVTCVHCGPDDDRVEIQIQKFKFEDEDAESAAEDDE